MATAEGSPWRIHLLIGLTIFLTLIYGAYGVFASLDTMSNYETNIIYEYNNTSTIGNGSLDETYEYDSESGQNFIDMLLGVGDFLTFAEIDNPFASMVLTSCTTVILTIIGYLIYTFIRDWIPFVG